MRPGAIIRRSSGHTVIIKTMMFPNQIETDWPNIFNMTSTTISTNMTQQPTVIVMKIFK
eukprot:m.105523 g.105523  ORF g.105523 m.105523 type:complete len:59 (-) comp15119_c0_seq2:219-395(-)